MAIEVTEAILFVIIGVVVGTTIIFALMQSRISRKVEQLYDKKKFDLESQFQQQYRNQYSTELDKWKAEYELLHKEQVETQIKGEVNRALTSQRSTVKGRVNEQLAPLFPEFTSKYVAADARFIGTPIDFIVFKNLNTISSESPQLLEVVFVEVKTGSPSLTKTEKAVKAAIDNLRVKFETIKISINDNLTSPQEPQIDQTDDSSVENKS